MRAEYDVIRRSIKATCTVDDLYLRNIAVVIEGNLDGTMNYVSQQFSANVPAHVEPSL